MEGWETRRTREGAGTWLRIKVFAVQSMRTGVQLLRTQVDADGYGGLFIMLAFGKGRKELQRKLAS